jgi:hypothetical protein
VASVDATYPGAEILNVTTPLFVPRGAPDLHIAGTALRAERPKRVSLSPLSRAGVAVKPSRARLIFGAGAAWDFGGVLSAIWAAPETLFHARLKVYFSRIRGRTYCSRQQQV